MGKGANFIIVNETKDHVTIQDIGPWGRHMTVTNDAEGVVARLSDQLNGRRLFYFDSDGDLDELLIKDGKFAGFGPGPTRLKNASQ